MKVRRLGNKNSYLCRLFVVLCSNNLNEMHGELYLPCNTPEPPKKNFFVNLFSATGLSDADKDDLCEFLMKFYGFCSSLHIHYFAPCILFYSIRLHATASLDPIRTDPTVLGMKTFTPLEASLRCVGVVVVLSEEHS